MCSSDLGGIVAELITGIGAVPSFGWGSVVFISGGIDRWQISLSGFQPGAFEVVGEYYEAIAPPCGCCIRQVHEPQAATSSAATRTLLMPPAGTSGSRMNPQGKGGAFAQIQNGGEHQGDEHLENAPCGGSAPVPRAYGLVGPAVSPPDVLRGRGRIFPAPARGTPHPLAGVPLTCH